MFKIRLLSTTLALMVIAGCSSGTVDTARTKGQETDRIMEKGREFGLTCITRPEQCSELIARAEKNPRFKEALLVTKAKGVGIQPGAGLLFAGHIGNGYVIINTLASDERIIEFITKK